MTNVDRLIHEVARTFKAQKTSSFFINGAPGSGCSFFLARLAEVLPVEIQRAFLLGPYALGVKEVAQLPRRIAEDLSEAGFASGNLVNECPGSLHQAWKAFSSKLEVGQRQSFLVMVDLSGPCIPEDIKLLADIFSAVRFLESDPFDHAFGLYHIVSGFWDPVLLANHYEKSGVSFPYTKDENYQVREGVDDIVSLRPAQNDARREAWNSLLVELTGGYLSVVDEVYDVLGDDELRFGDVVRAVDELAQKGRTAQRLVNLWSDFMPGIREVLQHLLANRVIHLNHARQYQELMRAAGIAKLTQVGNQHFLEVKSWFAERVLAHHGEKLGVDSRWLADTLLDEPLPQLLAFNSQAYQLLNDIETKVRQFVSTYLHHHTTSGQHILKGRASRAKRNGCDIEDAYQRAQAWRTRSTKKHLNTDFNPLIAYCSTTDLAELTREVGVEQGRQEWRMVADLLEELVPIRDAVMHNQLIDEKSLERLLSLQERIYSLLGNPG